MHDYLKFELKLLNKEFMLTDVLLFLQNEMSEIDFLKKYSNTELTNLIIFLKNNQQIIYQFQEKLWFFYFLKTVEEEGVSIFDPILIIITWGCDKSTKFKIISYIMSVWCVLSFNDVKASSILVEEDSFIWANRYEIISNFLEKAKKFFIFADHMIVKKMDFNQLKIEV
jgi:hypothetical protein